MARPITWLLSGLCPAVLIAVGLAPDLRAEQRAQDFSSDPGWHAAPANHITAQNPPTVRQNFGWQPTQHAGAQPGEIGGELWRSLTPAWYGTPVGPLTYDNEMSFSGVIAARRAVQTSNWETGSTIFLGFFNPERDQGWRPRNFIGLRFESRLHKENDVALNDTIILEPTSMNDRWIGFGGFLLRRPGGVHETAMKNMKEDDTLTIPTDGSRHTFSFRWIPAGGKGFGQMEIYFDGVGPYYTDADEGGRKPGLTATHFGIMNTLIPGNEMIAYFGDLALNGKPVDLSSDPGWPSAGNRDAFLEPNQYGTNDFGYRTSAHAGGAPGEMGGRFWRVEEFEREFQGNYGDDVGALTLNDRLEANGRIAALAFSNDSGVFLGWYNSKDQTWPLKNFVGAYMDSAGSLGRHFAAHCANAVDQHVFDSPPPLLFPDGKSREWSISYDPTANDGGGALTVTLDGQTQTLNLKPGFKAVGATLDRFGVFNMQDNNGKWCDVFFDDITYTAADAPALP